MNKNMEIYKTYIGLLVPKSLSTMIKIHEMINGTYVLERSNGYLEIIHNERAQHYLNNFIELDENK